MIYRDFGKTGLKASLLGMGCSSLGGSLFLNSSPKELERLLMHALESGVNFFDTAPTYNLGNSEKMLGRVFRSHRRNIVLASKVGIAYTPAGRFISRVKPYLKPVRNLIRPFQGPLSRLHKKERRINYSPEFIRKSVEGSLRRLQTEYLDILQLHHPSTADLERGNFLGIFNALKKEGKIKSWGVSAENADDALICLRYGEIDAVQIPVNLIDQAAIAKFLPSAFERKVAVIARIPLAQGLLTSVEHQVKADYFALDNETLNARKSKAGQYRFLETPFRTMAQAAFQFLMQFPGITTIIPGFGSLKQLEEGLGALTLPPFTAEEKKRIQEVG